MRRSLCSRTGVVAVSAVLALAMSGCGDDKKDEKSSDTTTPATTPVVQGSPAINIDMFDFGFQVSGPLTAGGTIKLANKGLEFHMIGIGRFKPGKTLTDLQTALSQAGEPGGGSTTTTVAGVTTTSTVAGATTTSTVAGATTTSTRATSTTRASAATTTSTTVVANPTADILDEVGVPGAFVSPGEAAEVTVPSLQPGMYALVCFVPSEGDGAPHFVKGMINQFEVVAGATPAPPTADTTYKVAPGKAVEGPATLTAGHHVIKFEAAPGSEQLEPSLVRLNVGTTLSRFETTVNSIFESDKPPAKGTAAKVPGQVVFGAFDLLNVTEFYLAVDLKAGNYAIDAADTDNNAAPSTHKEILNIKVA